MTAATVGMDVVEVLRGTTAGPVLVAAGAAGGVAVIATVVAVVVWWHDGAARRGAEVGDSWRTQRVPRVDGVTVSLALALATSTLEAGLLVVDGAGTGDRWLVAVAVRLAVLAAVFTVHRDGIRHQRPALPATVRVGLALVLLVTAALGAPATALSGRLWWAATGVVGLLVLVGVLWGVLVAADRLAPAGAAVALIVLLGAPLAVWSAPDAVPPHHQERVVVDGMVLDLTFAPVQVGTNEAHLYAFDREGRSVPVTDVHLAVAGVPGSEHPMFEVSPDHHLSYALQLPAGPPWTVSVTLRGADERHREVTLHLDRP